MTERATRQRLDLYVFGGRLILGDVSERELEEFHTYFPVEVRKYVLETAEYVQEFLAGERLDELVQAYRNFSLSKQTTIDLLLSSIESYWEGADRLIEQCRKERQDIERRNPNLDFAFLRKLNQEIEVRKKKTRS